MPVQFVFKHMETSEALQNYAETKVEERIAKYSTKPVNSHVIFSVQHGSHMVECNVKGGDGFNFEAHAESHDMYASVDLMVDKLAAQLKKHKEKLKEHKGHSNAREISEVEDQIAAKNNSDAVDASEILSFEKRKNRL